MKKHVFYICTSCKPKVKFSSVRALKIHKKKIHGTSPVEVLRTKRVGEIYLDILRSPEGKTNYEFGIQNSQYIYTLRKKGLIRFEEEMRKGRRLTINFPVLKPLIDYYIKDLKWRNEALTHLVSRFPEENIKPLISDVKNLDRFENFILENYKELFSKKVFECFKVDSEDETILEQLTKVLDIWNKMLLSINIGTLCIPDINALREIEKKINYKFVDAFLEKFRDEVVNEFESLILKEKLKVKLLKYVKDSFIKKNYDALEADVKVLPGISIQKLRELLKLSPEDAIEELQNILKKREHKPEYIDDMVQDLYGPVASIS